MTTQSSFVRFLSKYKLFQRNFQHPVMLTSGFTILWSLIAGLSSLHNVRTLIDYNADPRLVRIYYVLGFVYLAVLGIEAFGFASAFRPRLKLVQIFAYLSISVPIIIGVIHTIQTSVHFMFKNALIATCIRTKTADHIIFTGFFGPIDGNVQVMYEDWCIKMYNHDALPNIVALTVITSASAFFALCAFFFYEKLKESSSASQKQVTEKPDDQPQGTPEKGVRPDDETPTTVQKDPLTQRHYGEPRKEEP